MKNSNESVRLYPLGRSLEETERLQQQSQFYNPFTRRLFANAGITAGMKVLDAGCGAGDVAFIAAELVGPQGSVLGVDRDPHVIEAARKRCSRARLENVSFVEGDICKVALNSQFDAVVGRLILMYLPDPVAIVRKLAGYLRAGGVVAFQEADWTHKPTTLPPSQCAEKIYHWMLQCFQIAGVETQMGMKLYKLFLDAGLSEPQMCLEAPIGGGANWDGYAYTANSVRSLLPALLKLNVATEEEVDIDNLAARFRDEVAGQGGVVMLSPFVSAWTVKR
ncbi:MAG: class I SAM-dependent methyltransferase [Pyrinomonadaceae bacterium]